MKYFNGRSKCAVIAGVWCLVYGIYLIAHFWGALGSSDGTEVLGGLIAGAMVMPHLVMVVLAAIFFLVGIFIKKPWGILVGSILVSVALVMFPMYFMFVLVPIILGFIGFANQRKLSTENAVSAE